MEKQTEERRLRQRPSDIPVLRTTTVLRDAGEMEVREMQEDVRTERRMAFPDTADIPQSTTVTIEYLQKHVRDTIELVEDEPQSRNTRR